MQIPRLMNIYYDLNAVKVWKYLQTDSTCFVLRLLSTSTFNFRKQINVEICI